MMFARLISFFTVCALLGSCAEGPSLEVMKQLDGRYYVDSVDVTFLDGITVSVADLASIPDNALRAKVQNLVASATKTSLNEFMKGQQPARAIVVVC